MSRPDDTGPGAEVDALVAAYALDVLDGAERRDVEALLRRSPELVARLAEFQAAAATWGEGAEAAPPAAMRERVMAALDDVEQLPGDGAVGGGLVPERASEEPAGAPAGHLSVVREPGAGADRAAPSGRRAHGRRRQRRPVLAVLLAAAVADDVARDGVTGRQLLQPRAQQQELAGALDRITAAPDARTVEVASDAAPDLAGSRLVYSASQQEAVVTADGAPAPGEDRVYAVWRLEEDGGVRLASTFTAGGGVIRGDLDDAVAIAVTVEPEDPGTLPTTPVVAQYELVG